MEVMDGDSGGVGWGGGDDVGLTKGVTRSLYVRTRVEVLDT